MIYNTCSWEAKPEYYSVYTGCMVYYKDQFT